MANEIDKIINRVRQLVAGGRSVSGIAIAAGLHKNTLYGMSRDDWNPRAETLRALERVMPELERTSQCRQG